MKTLDVHGRRWFQRTYGNTYNSASITIDYGLETEKRVELGIGYGYGSMFEQRAVERLKEAGYPVSFPLSKWCRENGVIYRESVVDVPRRKDL